MGSERGIVVSNSGPLIHLARIYRLNLLKELFGKVAIPVDVKIEVVDAGMKGAADAFLIENEIRDGWIVIEEIETSGSIKEIAESAGIEIGETAAIMLARRKNCLILLDDLAARRFATGLGLEVAGSIGVLIRSAKIRKPFEDRGTGCVGATFPGDVAQCRCLRGCQKDYRGVMIAGHVLYQRLFSENTRGFFR